MPFPSVSAHRVTPRPTQAGVMRLFGSGHAVHTYLAQRFWLPIAMLVAALAPAKACIACATCNCHPPPYPRVRFQRGRGRQGSSGPRTRRPRPGQVGCATGPLGSHISRQLDLRLLYASMAFAGCTWWGGEFRCRPTSPHERVFPWLVDGAARRSSWARFSAPR
jgi:hypothetical protein